MALRVIEIEKALNLTRGQIEQALKFLSMDSPAPVIKSGYKWARTAVPYRMDRERIRRLTEKREIEWQEVQEYIENRPVSDVVPHPCARRRGPAAVRQVRCVPPPTDRRSLIHAYDHDSGRPIPSSRRT